MIKALLSTHLMVEVLQLFTLLKTLQEVAVGLVNIREAKHQNPTVLDQDIVLMYVNAHCGARKCSMLYFLKCT